MPIEESSSVRNFGSAEAGRELRLSDNPGQLPLTGRTVLIVEDDFLIADDFAAMLRSAGATVIGPAESLPQAIRMAQSCNTLDCALLDIDLQGVAVFPLARELRIAAIPMIFMTGIGCDNIPEEFADILCIGKPTGSCHVVGELISLLGLMPGST